MLLVMMTIMKNKRVAMNKVEDNNDEDAASGDSIDNCIRALKM